MHRQGAIFEGSNNDGVVCCHAGKLELESTAKLQPNDCLYWLELSGEEKDDAMLKMQFSWLTWCGRSS